MSLYRVTVMLEDNMPEAPIPNTPRPSSHLAAAYQWWELSGPDVLGEGTAVGGSWRIKKDVDQIAIMLLNVKGAGNADKITVRFSKIDAEADSPIAKTKLIGTAVEPHGDFPTWAKRTDYFSKKNRKAWATGPLDVVNSGRFAFTVDFDGATSFYLDPEMDIGN